MKCMMLVVGIATYLSAANAMAANPMPACTLSSAPLNYPAYLEVVNYNATASIPYTDYRQIFKDCDPNVYTRAVFNASGGELSSSSPFLVVLRRNESKLSAETKAWLEQNLELSFKFLDGAAGARVVDVRNNSSDFPILPGSPIGPTEVIGGIEYFKGNGGTGIKSFSLSLYQLTTTLKFVSSPSTNVVTELNSKPIRIKLGDLKINTRTIKGDILDKSTQAMYVDLQLKIKIPTCTMRDIHVDLGTANLGQLKSNTVTNSKDFKVEFQCDAVPSGSIYARITDAFNISNVNDSGVLLNQPTLSGAAKGVGVQLLTQEGQPLTIGKRAVFLQTEKKDVPIYRKALKAQLYRIVPNPSAGYVNAQATVLLDYE